MKNLKTNMRSLLIIVVILSFTLQSDGQAWQRTYAGDGIFAEVEQTMDGGFVATRYSDEAIFKVDAMGGLLWEYAPSGNFDLANAQSVEVLADGSIVAVGQAIVNSPYQKNVRLMKLDNDGNMIWEQLHAVGSGSVGPYLVAAIPGGGFYVGGQYGFLMKTDADGNELWRNTSHGMRGLTATSDGSAVFLVNDNTTGSNLLFVRKVDGNGIQLWDKAFVGNADLVGRQMTATSDGGFAITGFDNDNGSSDYFILKIDADGGQEFLKYFGTNQNDAGQGIGQTQDGGYLATGWSGLGGRITRLTKLDTQGDVQWERNYGAGEGLSVKELNNGHIIMLARGSHLFHLDSDGAVFKNKITGNIIEDLNADCSFQNGEPALEGWTVWANGPVRNFATTDNLGNFEIVVDTGSYEVVSSTPNFEWQPCTPTIPVNLATAPDSNDVGTFLMEEVTATMVTISGAVYDDANGNCQQDPGELGIPNCPVIAADEPNWASQIPQFQTTTDADGFYSFTVPAGWYYAVELPNTNPVCSACGPVFFEYVDAVPVTYNIGMECSNGPLQHVNGFVFFDENENCTVDLGETGMTGWEIDVARQGSTDTIKLEGGLSSNGEFSTALDTGTYYFIITPPNYLFLPCQTIQVVQVLPNVTPPVLFPLMPFDECPKMTVDVGTAFLRPCTESTYVVQYCNEGTASAEDAFVEITLPPDLIMGSSEMPFTPVSNGVFSFDIGDMNPGECHDFWFNATLVCDSEVGLTHCVEAHIYPDTICMDTAMFWDGSSIEVTADCEGDSIILNIANNGWGDMSEALNFIVVEDNVLIRDSNFQLASGNSTNLVVYPNGATIILQAQQSFGHPGESMPVVFVEGCGGDSISIGFVTQYPQNDADCFLAIDCRESINSFDPNIKEAQPKGITDAHFITPETGLDYQITFQNLGTAPALEVVLLDTLSEKLDTATLRTSVSSHEYAWELINGNILKFTFENIDLPQASLDSTASIGFVKYQIAQKPGNAAGTVINNKAAIYFDFNDPVITNTVTHQIPAPELFKNENIVLCEGEIFNGEIITQNTIVFDTVKYAFFDSIFIYEINVVPISETVLEGGICEGGTYIFNGEILTDEGVYTTALENTNGCDSLVSLSLTVFPDLSETIDTAVFIGGEIYGTIINSDTTLVIDLTDEKGCPYTLTVQVDVMVNSLETLTETRILISPNPNNGTFVVSGELPIGGYVSANIINTFGQKTATVFTDVYLEKTFLLEVNDAVLSSGTYYLMMKGQGWNKVSKMVVVK